MFATCRNPALFFLRLWAVFLFTASWGATWADEADSQRAFELVQQGVREFNASDFEAAAACFEEAISLTQDTDVLRFDQACVDLATGETENAREKLRDAASGSDPEVVQSAHYNLGILKVQQAKANIPEDPTTIPKKNRNEIVDQLEQAARSFRSTLEINRDHADAAYNLELVRMYLKYLKTLWKRQDEQKQEPEESLTQLILRLQQSFRDSMQRLRQLRDEKESASHRAGVTEFQQDIQLLDSEVQKIRPLTEQWLQAAMSGGQPQISGQPASQPTPEEVAAKEALMSIVDQLESASQETLSLTSQEEWSGAGVSSNNTRLSLHQLFLNVASYQEALQAAIQQQSDLSSTKTASVDAPDSTEEQSMLGQEQLLISDLVQAIQLRAEQQKPQIDAQMKQIENASQESSEPNSVPQNSTSSAPTGTPSTVGPPSVLQGDEQKKMLAGLSESMGRAISLSPDAILYADRAANLMIGVRTTVNSQVADPDTDPGFAEAKRAQEKVGLILEDIAEPLIDPESDQQQSSNQQQRSDQDQSDGEQSSNEESDDSQDSGDEESESPEKQRPDQKKGDEEQTSDSNNEKQDDSPPNSPKDMQQQQAEAVLRKAAEREQQYRELLKNLQERLGRKQATKDW